MNNLRHLPTFLIAVALLGFGAGMVSSQENPGAASTVQVHMVITDEALRDDSEVPILRPENVQVKQGKTSLKVDHLIPARGDNAALQLFILIDDTCDTSIGNSLNDLRDFINAQPATTVVGVAYMSNAQFRWPKTSQPIMLRRPRPSACREAVYPPWIVRTCRSSACSRVGRSRKFGGKS